MMETRARKAKKPEESLEPAKAAREKKSLFEYPSLPRWEMGAYFAFLVCCIAYGAYLVYEATNAYDYKRKRGQGGRRKIPFPLIGDRWRDMSNYEWRHYAPILRPLALGYGLHSLVFNVSAHFYARSRPRLWEAIRMAYSVSFCCFLFGTRIVANGFFAGALLFFVGWLGNRKLVIWAAAAPLLYVNIYYWRLICGTYWDKGFMPITFVSYKLLSYISFCSEFFPRAKSKTQRKDILEGLWDMFSYAFYLPYSMSLICIYKRYVSELRARVAGPVERDWGGVPCGIGAFALRLGLWTLLIEVALRFLHFEILLADNDFIRGTRLVTFMGLGWAAGQFFHLKYVVIFGLPSLFARIDGLAPLPGPICVPRLSLFSHMWRGFDRGLYQFFKEYIFLPIAAPTFSMPRKIIGMLTSYGFVLLWHGFYHNYIWWIILNIAELAIEQVSKGIYSIPAVKAAREHNLSDRNFRRLIAIFWIFPYACSFYSSYYFLSGSAVAQAMIDRMFWENNVKWTPFFSFVFFLCYCHAQCCMEIDRRYALQAKMQRGECKKTN